MPSWDLTITIIIVAAAAYYVAHNIYKTIKNASSGCSGGCSSCSQCHIKIPTSKNFN
ncbi:MAG: FeoB-associated Cys-rich membrane protein [Desulfuromonadales bacterium]|nr:FeoB-associated Cys-rich membrane protein [Desulfuromonadales bacterium]